MSTYKVIQDIEAEDKLVGPFTLRQFIYIGIVAITGFIGYMLAQANFLLALPLLPPILFFGALAAPIGGAQTTEIWLLAKIRFILKPRKRIWSQDGIQQLVTITAPKREVRHLTDNLSQSEVKSRLTALASTLDTRGWAVKYATGPIQSGDDRLIDTSAMATNEPVIAGDAEDVMDDSTSVAAQKLESMLQKSDQVHKQQLRQRVQNPAEPVKNTPDYWFMSQQPMPKGYAPAAPIKTVLPGSDDQVVRADDHGAAEQALLNKIHHDKANPATPPHKMKTLQPLSAQGQTPVAGSQNHTNTQAQNTQPNTADADILRLANNNDLNISTLAREAHRKADSDDNEVVISLH
jgi:hypothetical protein